MDKPMSVTTPLEREILSHYYCKADPYRACSPDAHDRVVHRMLSKGLLREIPKNEFGSRWGPTPGLHAYMEALAALPFPVQKWVMP